MEAILDRIFQATRRNSLVMTRKGIKETQGGTDYE